MARYTPGNVPDDTARMAEFVRAEIGKIAQAMETASERLTLKKLYAAPKKFGDGTVVLADGNLWKPIGTATPGYYGYYGGSWKFLG